MKIRPMAGRDLESVVRVHCDAFPNFFLTFLGPRFLQQFYAAVLDDPAGIALVADDDGRITGFAAGSTEPKGFYRRLLRRRFAPVALAVTPAIIRRPNTFVRVARRAIGRTRGDDVRGAELMSLAVAPAEQGLGVGRALAEAFAARAGAAGASLVWLKTDATENDRVKSFYERIGFSERRRSVTEEGRAIAEYALDLNGRRSIPFARPDIGEEEMENVRRVLESGWLTTGERVQEFERKFAAAVGAKHALALSSCTAGLHLALEAIGVQSGDEVIVPAYTFTATAEVVLYFGATPVIVDVDARTLNIDPRRIEEHVSAKTKAIIPVHFGGLPADIDAIRSIASPHRIAIIEDAAHAFPSRYRSRMIGSISDFTCFSFYATKPITTGEGGMLCTDNDEWAERCRIMSLHGISHDAWKRYRGEGSWFYEVVAPGFKYNMTDIAAAIGLPQLSKAEQMRDRRQSIAERYNDAFAAIEALELPPFDAAEDHAWHLYALRLNLDRLTVDRARFIEELRARGIGASVHFIPLHLHPLYRDRYNLKPEELPVSTREYLREVSLPIFSRMSDRDVEAVIAAVRDVAARFRA